MQVANWLPQVEAVEQATHGRALPSGQHQPLQALKIARQTHLADARPEGLKVTAVLTEGALESQNAYLGLLTHLPATAGQPLSGNKLVDVDPGHRCAQILADLGEHVRILEVCHGLDDRLGSALWIVA